MSRKSPPKFAKKQKNSRLTYISLTVVGIGAVGAFLWSARSPSTEATKAEETKLPDGPVTFASHVAPILFKECAPCHRAGQSGPFELLSYKDAQEHAKDIARVTAERIMPPWLPEHGVNEFKGERWLSANQIEIIRRWVDQGMPEGDPAQTPPKPDFSAEWQLGKPDFVLEALEYTLPAEGTDVYYNLVVPSGITSTQFVAGVEFLPGSRTVHHAFIMVDETRKARRLASKLNPPGYYGMDQPDSVAMPGGQLLGWQPGKIPSLAPPGLAWTMKPNTDMVLQLHLNPSGKPEKVQPKLGFHFTNQAPTNTSYRLRLTSLLLDIPAGESNYVTESSYTLPVDLRMIRVGGHAHYLCKEMQGYATLPNGETKRLLSIKDWDFKWQGDYEYKEPIFLPKGSKVAMRFTYDNSANNIRNPHNPPKRVPWGLGTTDEMGELYFQTLPAGPAEYQTLAMDYGRYFFQVSMDFYKSRVAKNPADAEMQQRLGRAYASMGQMEQSLVHLTEAIRLNPNDDLAYFDLGSVLLRQNRPSEAYTAFRNVIRINPEDSQALGSLGIISARAGRNTEARNYFLAALRIDPDDKLAQQYLQRLKAP